ncbi:MAG: hypothetical protein ACXABY_28445 [Candidatus Thorarchaeota archaeon]|jgi:hypothetical protein
MGYLLLYLFIGFSMLFTAVTYDSQQYSETGSIKDPIVIYTFAAIILLVAWPIIPIMYMIDRPFRNQVLEYVRDPKTKYSALENMCGALVVEECEVAYKRKDFFIDEGLMFRLEDDIYDEIFPDADSFHSVEKDIQTVLSYLGSRMVPPITVDTNSPSPQLLYTLGVSADQFRRIMRIAYKLTG